MTGLENIKQVWMVGIGGIGMSAIARYFRLKGLPVAGYDRERSSITESLEKEGVSVVFQEEASVIEPRYHDATSTLVIYTPAIPKSHKQLAWFIDNGFQVFKRSEVLGKITRESSAICVAGTHGKTTISTMAAHLFTSSRVGCTAFLGGVSINYNTNFLWNATSPFSIIEADEFDRSFLQLSPYAALVSAVDADHLDIYGTQASMRQAYIEFVKRILPNGYLIVKAGIEIDWHLPEGVKMFTYSASGEADFFASDISLESGLYTFTLNVPGGVKIPGLQVGIPGLLNVENAVGASALALVNGISASEVKAALPAFKGIARRFETHINRNGLVYIDDYAHHPEEIRATVNSVKAMFPNHRITGIFQPHLYSRTRDFAAEFAKSLELLDELILLDIYPARENPIPGVNASLIGNLVTTIPVKLCNRNSMISNLSISTPHVILTMGAGDIDKQVDQVKNHLLSLSDNCIC